ncbi:Nn.00g006380.m01.CDS01 [Neocucurbitaria sp. VM-36]
MPRAARNFCSRDSMPAPAIEPVNSSLEPPIDTPPKPVKEAMTWQQQKDFGKDVASKKRNSKRVQWKPFEQEALEISATIATENDSNWPVQQDINSTQGPYRKPRGKAATLRSTHYTNQPTPADTATADLTHDNDAQNPGKPTHKRPPRKRKPNNKGGNMTTLPKSAYIPPHLRKRDSATGAKVDLPPEHHTPSVSPAVSDKTKTEYPPQLHSSPNGADQPQNSLPTPATTPKEPEKPENSWAGWDAPTPDLPLQTRKAENPRWPRGPKPAPKKHVWPKASAMKYVSADSDGDGGISFKSNSNGDPQYDVKKLMDWNGDWLPPPEQWSARKGYTNRHFGQLMEQWMNGHGRECTDSMDISSDVFRGRATGNGDEVEHVLVDGVCNEIVPRYWLSAQVEGKPLREFWKEMPYRAPKALSEIDIMEHPPWWESYQDASSCFIDAVLVPEAKIDQADVDNHIDPFGLAPAADKIQNKHDRALSKHLRLKAKRNRVPPEPKFPIPQPEDRRIRPTTNMYLRPVQPADVRGIAEIYNYYVENTIAANEFDARSEAQMRDRINDITRENLPYLVAVAKGNHPKGTPGYVSEKIVGYINLDDYCDQSSMYRFTFEMEVYVHPGFVNQGIAKCLLDRLLEMANTGYNARGGYEYVNEYEYLKTGPSRVIKTILLNVHHQHGADVQWATDFLSAFKFVRAGRLSHVGFKKDQIVDISIYQHHTTETINPSSIPTVPLERN